MENTVSLLIQQYKKLRKKNIKKITPNLLIGIKSFVLTSVYVKVVSDFEVKYEQSVSELISKSLEGLTDDQIKKLRFQLHLIHEDIDTSLNFVTVLTIFMGAVSAFFITLGDSVGVTDNHSDTLFFMFATILLIVKRMSLIEYAGICAQLGKFIEWQLEK